MYTIAKILLITRSIEPVGKKTFATLIFDLGNKTFVNYITFLTSFNLGLEIHFFQRAPIKFLEADKISILVFSQYANFADDFSKNLITKL